MPGIRANLAAIKRTKKLAAEMLLAALEELLPGNKPISEVRLRNRWLEKLRSCQQIYPEGWYMPPPHGMAVLFSNDQDVSRTNFDVLRPEPMWPRDDIFLNRDNGIIMVYASPVDRVSYMVGDFEMMIYFGKQPAIQDHFRKVASLDYEIFGQVEVGMTLSDVAKIASKLMRQYGLANNVVSLNDPAGTNIGHTIPATDQAWTKEELAKLNGADWDDAKDVIAKKRRFVNEIETLEIKPGLAFTIEPRPVSADNPRLPMASFHTTALIHEDGRKELVTEFDQLAQLAGVDYLPKLSDF